MIMSKGGFLMRACVVFLVSVLGVPAACLAELPTSERASVQEAVA